MSEYFMIEVDKRYSGLAEGCCGLSCGGALGLSKPAEGEVCVDIGSGRGQDVIKMALEVGPKGFAYGIDIAEGMITLARKNARKVGVSNTEFIRTSLEDLKLPDNTADLVISNCTINHAADKQKVWCEVHRILKPKGRFVVSDIYAVEKIPAVFADDPAAVAECWAGAVTKEDYLLTLEQTGFKEVRIIEESQPYQKGDVLLSSFTVSGRKF